MSSGLGGQAQGLSANTISRLKQSGSDDHRQWRQRDLSQSGYLYWWADGVYSNVRMDNRWCWLVIIGVTEQGKKARVAVEEGFSESESSWYELMSGRQARGLQTGPKLAIGDGALGLWKAISQCSPASRHQRCWVHKMANVLNVLPKSVQPKMKAALQDICMAETRQDALAAYQRAWVRFKGPYPGAMERLRKDKKAWLAFYALPAEPWRHIRTTNPIESRFATVRLRTQRARNGGSRDTTLAIYKLLETAQKRWKRIRGFNLLTLVVNNVQFKDGEQVMEQSDRNVA